MGQKANKRHDLKERKAFLSRDDIFYESIFPYKGNVDGNVNDNIVLPRIILEEDLFEVNDEEFLPS